MKHPEMQKLIQGLAGESSGSTLPPRMTQLLDNFVAENVSSKNPIYPEEFAVLRAICGAIDGELNVNAAWRMVNDIFQTGVLARATHMEDLQKAIAANLHRSSVAYFRRETVQDIASGTLVGIGDKVFLATCSHSIPNRPVGKLSFVGMPLANRNLTSPVILDSGKDDDQTLRDVAYLELTREFVETLEKAVIPLSRIHVCGTGKAIFWTVVAGYPSAIIEQSQTGPKQLDLGFNFQCWANSSVLVPDDWHVLAKRKPTADQRADPDRTLDVFIAYPRDEEFVAYGTYGGAQLPAPFGMSGGGYWQKKQDDKKAVWNPEDYSLIAIQSQWWDLGRYLQATQVIHWLRLLWRKRPDVRADLENAFPGENLSM